LRAPPNSYVLVGWLATLALACGSSETHGPALSSAAGTTGAAQAGSSTLDLPSSGAGGGGASAGAMSGGAAGTMAMTEMWLDDVAVGPERIGCPPP